MTLFDRRVHPRDDEIVSSSDAATRALSVTAVENDFVNGVYERIAGFYDYTFGPSLHPGRLRAIQRMGITAGDRILEVGVGTGINLALYPAQARVVGIDLSASMLEKARARVARNGVPGVRLIEMDAADMKFADGSFDIVYAPYVISVVPDPVRVAREMYRVCRPGGKVIVLNHFRSRNVVGSRLERLITPLTLYIGFKADLDLPGFLAQAELSPVSIEKVNFPPIWSLVTCIKEAEAAPAAGA
jgi:phosphatidylethanolamine/phosphatidyl-N-methylethanolamine N-methyltransferase